MGIRGLASFVSSHGCLETNDFSDGLIIIDGLNLVHRLVALKECGMRSPFGGEYNGLRETAQLIVDQLRARNVTPVVIFDGGMDSHGKKLRTKLERFRRALFKIAAIHPGNPDSVFPQLAVDTVIQALRDVGVTTYSTTFEADGLVAWLAYRLDCPVASDDSDFFVFGVRCVTLQSLLAACIAGGRGRTFKENGALEVEMFCPEKFLSQFNLQRDHLAVFGSVLGNDVVPFMDTVSGFAQIAKPKFSTVGAGPSQAKVKNTSRHSQIAGFLRWISSQKPEAALEKFMGFLRSGKRDRIKITVMKSVRNYEMMLKGPCDQFKEFMNLGGKMSPTWDDVLLAETSLLSDDENLGDICPEWLLDRVRRSRCALPRFVNMLLFRVVFLTPVVECYDTDTNYMAVLSVIQKYADVLFSTVPAGTTKGGGNGKDAADGVEAREISLSIYCRRKIPNARKSALGKFPMTVTPRVAMKLSPDEVDEDPLRKRFLTALDVGSAEEELLALPVEERMFCLSFILWLRNEEFPPSFEHALAALVTHLILFEVEFVSRITSRKRGVLETELCSEKDERKAGLIRTKLACLRYFSVSGRIAQDRRCFDAEIVTYYEALKSLASWAASFGSLFGDPIQDLCPDRHFSGIFFYTFVTELRGKRNPLQFVQSDAFADSQVLGDRLNRLLRVVLPHGFTQDISEDKEYEKCLEEFRLRRIAGAYGGKKKRRNRTSKKQIPEPTILDGEVSVEDEEDDVNEFVYDAENRFAALKL